MYNYSTTKKQRNYGWDWIEAFSSKHYLNKCIEIFRAFELEKKSSPGDWLLKSSLVGEERKYDDPKSFSRDEFSRRHTASSVGAASSGQVYPRNRELPCQSFWISCVSCVSCVSYVSDWSGWGVGEREMQETPPE